MCGIAGYIGKSKRPKFTYDLITGIFDRLETRGIDASGVYGTEFGEDGRVIYHKEPVQSSLFIKKDFWSKLKNINTDLLLIHSRATSSEGGSPSCNLNNHPFISEDKKIGMVHNGTLSEARYLKNKYEIKSETDSEYLLRIFEHGIDNEFIIPSIKKEMSSRIFAIGEIWKHISTGAMAVALAERMDDYSKQLYLFRNSQRPLWLADLRDLLGQFFFFSCPDIWYTAIENNYKLKKECWSSVKLIEVPTKEIWSFSIDQHNSELVEENINRFKLDIKKTDVKINQKNDKFKNLKLGSSKIELVTAMDKNDELIKNKIVHDKNLWDREKYEKNRDFPNWDEFEDMQYSCNNSEFHQKHCSEIAQISKDISTSIDNLSDDSSISSVEYDDILMSLEKVKKDLKEILEILE
jgi:glucosamine 6-phosphate synthetase-like amidotransferase/phosphosugar isomerase protein